ncbi:MAG TPA: glycosyltransferase [Rhodothermales bacterium]|nr:glycosyltransferase [Rhodothermales bacterium]
MEPTARPRRVLVVAYYFPPAGGPGVQRVLKAVKYLHASGWQPTVLTVADGAFPQHDPSLAADVPPGVEVVRTRALDPFGVYGRLTGKKGTAAVPVGTAAGGGGAADRVARWARANLFLPDARVGWVPFATRAALRLHRAERFDAVLTSGPPHSVHLIGRALARKTGVPWVADFRDPWTGINFYHELPMTGAARRFDRALEGSVLREAGRLVTVSPTWAAALADKAGRSAEDVAVVHNGFDAADFAGLEGVAPPADRFVLAHVGSLYGARNPQALWTALGRLRAAGRLERFTLKLVGAVDAAARAEAAAHGLDGLLEATGYVPHAEAVRAMRAATALLLLVEGFGLDRGMITGKLYEYLGSGRPVVGLGPADGDAARLLTETGAGRMLARDDADALTAYLDALITDWEQGTPRPGAPPEAAAPYTREAQTALLAQALEEAL